MPGLGAYVCVCGLGVGEGGRGSTEWVGFGEWEIGEGGLGSILLRCATVFALKNERPLGWDLLAEYSRVRCMSDG